VTRQEARRVDQTREQDGDRLDLAHLVARRYFAVHLPGAPAGLCDDGACGVRVRRVPAG
jgi:hypothetical protein